MIDQTAPFALSTLGAEIATDSKASLADQMYSAEEPIVSGYRPGLSGTVQHLADLAGVAASDREALLNETALTFYDAGIGADQAPRLLSVIAKHASAPADDATVRRWQADSLRELRDRYGVAEGEKRIAAAKEFLAARPAFAKLLTESGAGSHPDVVRALTENPRALRLPSRSR